MAEADIKREENTLQKKPPQVPIPTYRWEEIKRLKLKGGYPWTHLYKDPFSDEPHPEHYTMEEFRRSKSSSTLTRPNTLEIQELPNGTPSEKGSADPIITEAVTPEAPPKKAFSARDSIVSVKTLESAESSDNISQYLDKDEIKDSETEEKKSETEDKTEQTKMEEDEQEKPNPDQMAAGPSTNAARGERAKSEEPTRKRKLSIESSYSRISLSKLAVLKKLKDAKEKVKLPKFSFRKHKEEIAKKKSEQDKAEKEKKRKEKRKEEYERLHADKPVYIHIPLRPPPGETDEFSYLEFQGNKEILPSDQQAEVASSPDSTDVTEVQFIVLTPPSDDEVLSDHTIPETPSESEKFFDTTKIEELKTLAKNVVDQAIIASNKLETVKEENGNGKEATPPPPPPPTQLPSEIKENVAGAETEEMKMEVNEETPSTSTVQEEKMVVDESPEKMLIDEEDGLRSSDTISVPKSEDTKETQNTEQLSSQVEEKRLSFRRKFKKSDPDRIYEDVQVGGKTDDEKMKAADVSQSMSVDEEKAYLEQKVMNHTSLEEDYNKWSKTNDHEYEPVCPPPDDAPIPPPSLQVINASNPDSSNVAVNPERYESSHDTQLTAQELQSQIEEQYFTQEQTESTSQVEQPPSQQQEQKGKQVESNKFQQAIKDQAGKFKTKIQGIKRPHITMPSKPTFKIEKPKINFPKIPDTTTIHLPSFNITKKRTPKQSLRERQFSTESNAGDSKKHHLFDFSTYPRWFGRKKKDEVDTSSLKDTGEESAPPVEFATVPRSNLKKKALASKWAQRFKEKAEEKQQRKHNAEPKDRWEGKDVIRIPLHSEESMDTEQQREESLETETISHTRFNEDIDAEEGAYHKENQEIHRASPFSNEYNSRWTHGTFHQRESPPDFDDFIHHQQVTDLDNDIQEPETPRSGSYDVDTSRDTQSSRGSLGSHRRGVVEEISADEFIIRQKGISQDDIDVRKYLTSEIREAFNSPQNVLYQLESEYDRNYDLTGSNQSLPEKKEKRTPIKKPKRKKTPHVSQEEMSLEEEDYPFPEETLPPVPPARPVRKNKKEKKNKKLIPFQETIPLESEKHLRKTDSVLAGIHDDIRYYDEKENPEAYENECMEGIEQPEIHVTDPYAHNVLRYQAYENTTEINEQSRKPEPPPRKQKSLRSLDYAEDDLILSSEIHHVESILKRTEDQIIPVSQEPPQKPSRNRSRTRSQSLATSQPDEENVSYENQQVPCVEEPCIQDIRDPMGYAIIDKTKIREPPLPPPRTPPRRRRSLRSSSGSSEKFATVPRSDSQPIRPLRNYSTLGPSRPPRIKSSLPNLTDEEKENIDITPYIEIDEEATRRLQSGAVIQKMKDRPLPAPPRPPRKTKFPQDENAAPISLSTERLEESEVSTQTEPLPEDIEIAPEPVSEEQSVTRNIILQTPTHYTHEECITHGSLIVEPLNGAKIIPDHEFSKIETSRERIIPVTTEDEETSEIPDEFHRLSNPPPKPTEEKLKAQTLHVEDLDVNRLTVNELLANKISVSQIDGVTIQVNEITSRDGAALKVNEIELPSHVIQQLLEKIQSAAPSSILVEPREQSSLTAEVASTEPTTDDLSTQLSSQVAATVDDEQKKTSIVQQADVSEEEEPPQRPPRQNEPVKLEDEPQPPVEDVMPPRPPRSKTEEITDPYLSEQEQQLITALEAEDNLDVGDEPPPRPPNPASEYFPSQPPASFYALRAEEYKQEDIPLPPRRRRYHHQKVVSRSSSDEESSPAVVSRRRVRTTPEPTIPQLTCQLAKACSTAAERQMKRLISHIVTHVLNNEDGQQDLHVTIAILLVLIAGLILLGFGEGRTTVHHHHWEFFNPPKEL